MTLYWVLIVASVAISIMSLIISSLTIRVSRRSLELMKESDKLVEEKVEETLAMRRQRLYDHGRRLPARPNDSDTPRRVHKTRIRSRLMKPQDKRDGFIENN